MSLTWYFAAKTSSQSAGLFAEIFLNSVFALASELLDFLIALDVCLDLGEKGTESETTLFVSSAAILMRKLVAWIRTDMEDLEEDDNERSLIPDNRLLEISS